MPVVSVPADPDTIAYMTKRVTHFEEVLAEIANRSCIVPDYVAWATPPFRMSFLRPGDARYDECRDSYRLKVEEDLKKHQGWFANGMPQGKWVDDKDMGCCYPP